MKQYKSSTAKRPQFWTGLLHCDNYGVSHTAAAGANLASQFSRGNNTSMTLAQWLAVNFYPQNKRSLGNSSQGGKHIPWGTVSSSLKPEVSVSPENTAKWSWLILSPQTRKEQLDFRCEEQKDTSLSQPVCNFSDSSLFAFAFARIGPGAGQALFFPECACYPWPKHHHR